MQSMKWLTRMRTPLVSALIVAAAAAGLSACGSSSSNASTTVPTSHTLNLSFLQDPGQPPDPAVYYAGQGLILQDNVYDGLVQYAPNTPDRKIVPDLATSWTVSPDLQTYTFQLRQGVVFHDGTPFTSAAVGPSFARDAAVNGGPAYMAQAVASVQTPDPYTAVVTLTQPNSAFLDYLAAAYGPRMMSPTGLAAHAGSDNDQTYLQTHDLGSGPYTLTQAKVGVMYQVKSFPQYWGTKPYYTTVNLPVIDSFNTEQLEFNNGQIAAVLHDLTNQAIKSYQASSSVKVYTLPTLQSEYLYVNPSAGFLTTASNRKALLKAINLKQILADVYPGLGTVGTQIYPRNLVPAGMATQDNTYDPSVLKTLVASLPASQKAFTIGYDTSSPSDQLIASILTDTLDQVGLSVKSVGYQTGTIYGWSPPGTVPADAPDLLVEFIWPDAYNPYQWADIGWGPTGGVNIFHCVVPNITSQLNQAVATNDTALFGQVGDAAAATGCWQNMVNRSDVFVAQPWLKGLPQGHVVAYPYTVSLAALYPG
jgi:peptide/nickel transport system substrate-binding protein